MFGDVVSRHVYSCATTFRGQGKFASLFWSVDGDIDSYVGIIFAFMMYT